MKKIQLVSLFAALLVTTVPAVAQTAKFEGISSTLSAAVLDGSVDASSESVVSIGRTRVSTGIDATYGFALNNQWVLGVGVGASIGSPGILDVVVIGGKIKNQKSFYLQPTYVLNANTALYAKVGKSKANLEFSDGGFSSVDGYSVSVNGSSMGLGIKSYLTDNVFVQAELLKNDYGSLPANANDAIFGGDANVKASTKSLGLAIGYRF